MHALMDVGYPTVWVVWTIYLTTLLYPPTTSLYLYNTFQASGDYDFNHLRADIFNGQLYVTAKNRLYHLSPNLQLHEEVRTGPESDNPSCQFDVACDSQSVTDVWNKVLLIDYEGDRLILCNNVFHGRCDVRPLSNISSVRRQQVEQTQPQPVVANDVSSSSVAIIVPAPYEAYQQKQNVLVVGSTYTDIGLYKDSSFAVATRSLANEDLFLLYHNSPTTNSRILIQVSKRADYLVRYVYSFHSHGFTYLLSTQHLSSENLRESPYISKLIRMCQNDTNYHSYTEIPLTCVKDGRHYNLVQSAYLGKAGAVLAANLSIAPQDDVLFAVFSNSTDPTSNIPSRQSALCIYSIKYVMERFRENIARCFRGEGNTNLAFIRTSLQCQETSIAVDNYFCGLDTNSPLGGEMPVRSRATLTWSDTVPTAIATSVTENYTVAFVGTSGGHIKKIAVEGEARAVEYDDLTIEDGEQVLQDLTFDRNKEYLYVMTRRKITKMKVQECQSYDQCSTCLRAGDPYCGWCALEDKCSLHAGCTRLSDPLHWVPYRDGQCSEITSLDPSKIQRTTARNLRLTISPLPQVEGDYQCAFTMRGLTIETEARRSDDYGVTCPTPNTDILPDMPLGEHYYTAKLSVRLRGGKDFVVTDFIFYDCSSYSSCTECTSSPFPCDWCVNKHHCTHDAPTYCRSDYLINAENRVGVSARKGPAFCPRINYTDSMGPEILVANGYSRKISVQAVKVQNFQTGAFYCQFNVEGNIETVRAESYQEGIITCPDMTFSYTGAVRNRTAKFAIIWDTLRQHPLDNPSDIHILMYKCERMADNCGFCLALEPQFACGWCELRCTMQNDCHDRDWLDRSATCPDPKIINISPSTGPLGGGTRVTIEGRNLGKTFEDIRNSISINAQTCDPIEELYVRTERIVCETRPVDAPQSGQFRVQVGDYEGLSQDTFHYVDPIIYSMHPLKGPVAGGTVLNISGKHMNAGSNITVWLETNATPNKRLLCEVMNASFESLQCKTSPSTIKIDASVFVRFDNQLMKASNNFIYSENPKVTKVSPEGGIPSGGKEVFVHGVHFDHIQQPYMYISHDGGEFASKCEILSRVDMICLSPVITGQNVPTNAEGKIEVEYGFIMDNVEDVRNLSGSGDEKFSMFTLYPDPIALNFTEPDLTKYYKGDDFLTIRLENQCDVCTETDFVVRIGTGYCNVTSVSKTVLNCHPPENRPPAVNAQGHPDRNNKMPQVFVQVGGNKTYMIGYLSYDTPSNTLSLPIIISIAVGAAVLIAFVVIILIAYKRKSTESERVLKSMQDQMDVLELKVAAECKEAFAELQTDMSELTSDLSGYCGMPFLDYRQYAVNVLFPVESDKTLLNDLDIDPIKKVHVEKSLKLFEQLILNKTFLLLFIRTLESNKYFSMKDRVKVASLIMVILQNRMEYATDILKTLLADLIERLIDSGSHPKLLLRRTESVAEKMLSSWFTFLLYKFLRECAGEPLFLLYRAIKQQIDKGPVDYITNEAKYSLSEEKLIRQQIDYRVLNIYVSTLENQYEPGQPVCVKVLDCDTVTQVKDKILDALYKNTPYSARPHSRDLELEWRTGTQGQGRLPLRDEDVTSKPDGDWMRLNTLRHYKVPDSANLVLTAKQPSMFNLSTLSDKSDKSHRFENSSLKSNSFKMSPSLSRATSPMMYNQYELESQQKRWHLVKPHEPSSMNGRDGHERGNKMVSEIYLTRLLATKGTLQKFVDDLFDTIFSVNHRGTTLPLAIKYMFDFLDDQALQHGITDPEVVHTWKSNSLPLRFWVNLIKNPNFVFNISKSNIVDSCLSVVAQTFMDSCSTADHQLSKDSPSSKLLYAKDIPGYKQWVERYYTDINVMPAISDQDMNAMLAEESRQHMTEFNASGALFELYGYACKYDEQLKQVLREDEFSRKNNLADRLDQVHATIAYTDR